jgi:hypothetical protein
MDKNKIKFQSVKIKFPKKLYFGLTWVESEDGQKMLIPHKPVFATPSGCIDFSKQVYEHFKKGKIEVYPEIVMVTLTFFREVPLKQKYWDNPSYKYKELNRLMEFLNAISSRHNYNVLITPDNTKSNLLTAPIPFLKTKTVDDIEVFMLNSDWHVDPTAKTCALYEIEGVVGLNIFTREIVKKDEEESRKEFVN